MTQVTTKLHVILLLYDAQQRGGGSAEQSHRCVFRGPQPVAHVHEHGAKRCSPDARSRSMPQLVTMALPLVGRSATMGVPGEGELVAVGVEKLKDAGLGSMEKSEAEVGVAVGSTGDGGVVVEVVVGVVDTCGGDAHWPYFEFVTRLVGVAPAAFDEGGPHAFPGECDAADLAFFAQR